VQITVKLYASFKIGRFKSERRECPEGTLLVGVAGELGIPERDLGITLINGSHAKLHDPLNDGDVVSLMPRISGG
jgi:molybdopterin converting factor small subunit